MNTLQKLKVRIISQKLNRLHTELLSVSNRLDEEAENEDLFEVCAQLNEVVIKLDNINNNTSTVDDVGR